MIRCTPAAEQPAEPGKIAVAAEGLNIPAGLSGVAVKAYLDAKTPQGEWQLDETGLTVSSGTAVFTARAPDSRPGFFG